MMNQYGGPSMGAQCRDHVFGHTNYLSTLIQKYYKKLKTLQIDKFNDRDFSNRNKSISNYLYILYLDIERRQIIQLLQANCDF